MKVGNFSRGGVARGAASAKAVDHDMAPDAILVPLGILELHRGATPIHQPLFVFGHSKEARDFIADGLERWWAERKMLHLELDNGPEIARSRTQFMKRLVDFVDRHRAEVRLVYRPPDHSKYNPIERCWGVLEQHGNGTLLNTVEAVRTWAGSTTWRGARPLVREITTTDARGVRLTKALFRPIAERLIRSKTLPKWSLSIRPEGG